MAVTQLYRECFALYQSLPRRKIGEYGRQNKIGDIIAAFVDLKKVMLLYANPNPAERCISLLLSMEDDQPRSLGGPRITVYADPQRWVHGKEIFGGTEQEARHLLDVFTRMRDASHR